MAFQSDMPGLLDATATQTKLCVRASSDWNDTSSVNASIRAWLHVASSETDVGVDTALFDVADITGGEQKHM